MFSVYIFTQHPSLSASLSSFHSLSLSLSLYFFLPLTLSLSVSLLLSTTHSLSLPLSLSLLFFRSRSLSISCSLSSYSVSFFFSPSPSLSPFPSPKGPESNTYHSSGRELWSRCRGLLVNVVQQNLNNLQWFWRLIWIIKLIICRHKNKIIMKILFKSSTT